jgi:hypothetical protein
MYKSQWSTADFDAMSWHDVHVYGFRLADRNPHHGTADLIFDVDYILEWITVGQGFTFAVAQASLRFHQASGLRFSLDYKAPTAAMCPFSLAGIERRTITYPTGAQSFEWELEVNWPTGKIEFEAPGFTQVLVGPIHRQPEQSLARGQRS